MPAVPVHRGNAADIRRRTLRDRGGADGPDGRENMHPAGDRLRKSPVIVCEKQKKHYPNEGSYAIIILNRYPQVPGRKKEGQRWAKTHP